MTKNNNEGKCAFGVFLDIIDSLQELNKKNTSQAGIKKCPFCYREIEAITKNCGYCGKSQPE